LLSTKVNALVGDNNDQNSFVYVGRRTDVSAAKAGQSEMYGGPGSSTKQPVATVTLDSFFPSGTKVQNLKIDVQGNEMHVLKGAERLLKENQGRLKLRFEAHAKLLGMAGTVLVFGAESCTPACDDWFTHILA
jgi:FkbM family methyltransferase